MKTLDFLQVEEILQGSGNFGFRGLNGIYGSKEYKEGEYLECSINDWDNRGIEYNPELERLNGTSAICVSYTMMDEEIVDAYNVALNYSDCGKVILVSGTESEYGYDNGEVILSNWGDGAMFLGFVEFEKE